MPLENRDKQGEQAHPQRQCGRWKLGFQKVVTRASPRVSLQRKALWHRQHVLAQSTGCRVGSRGLRQSGHLFAGRSGAIVRRPARRCL
jgi:hypothetical protein